MKNRTCRKQAQPHKVAFGRKLRENPTPAEKILWERLRCRRLGVKFRRQHIILGWIVDFWSSEARVVVEVDGAYHSTEQQREKDRCRDRAMNRLGIKVIRVSNGEVFSNTLRVADRIRELVGARS